MWARDGCGQPAPRSVRPGWHPTRAYPRCPWEKRYTLLASPTSSTLGGSRVTTRVDSSSGRSYYCTLTCPPKRLSHHSANSHTSTTIYRRRCIDDENLPGDTHMMRAKMNANMDLTAANLSNPDTNGRMVSNSKRAGNRSGRTRRRRRTKPDCERRLIHIRTLQLSTT